jgi:hypothetical protein
MASPPSPTKREPPARDRWELKFVSMPRTTTEYSYGYHKFSSP